MTHLPPDPFLDDLDELGRLYQLLSAKIEPGQSEGSGRRPQPGSRPPLQIPPVSLMDEAQRMVRYLIGQARFTLLPAIRIDITGRTGARCPYCQGDLIAWLYGDNPEPPEVLCRNPQADIHAKAAPEGGAPWRWEGEDEIRRFGVVAGLREDHRFTTLSSDTATG